MSRAKKFNLLLIVQLVATVMFKTISVDVAFYMNPFYIVGMALGIYLMLKAVVYTCSSCGKHQIMLSWFKYRLPTDNCYTCSHKMD